MAFIPLLEIGKASNIQWGYANLGKALLHAGDLEDALAALSVSLLPLGHLKAEGLEDQPLAEGILARPTMHGETVAHVKESTLGLQQAKHAEYSSEHTPDGSPVTLFDFTDRFWECDGPCDTLGNQYRELHFCTICPDTCFCEKCILRIKATGARSDGAQSVKPLPYRRCDPNHTFVQAYPIPDLGGDALAATVNDGYVELCREWLRKVAERWADIEYTQELFGCEVSRATVHQD